MGQRWIGQARFAEVSMGVPFVAGCGANAGERKDGRKQNLSNQHARSAAT